MPVRIYAPLTVPPVTGPPPDVEEGSLWYSSNADQLLVSDGQPGRLLVVGPQGNLPIIMSNRWCSLPTYGAPTTMTPTNNRAYALPLWPGRSATLTGVAAEVTLLGVGNLRAGVYTAHPATNMPQTLVADYGTVSTGVAGVKSWTGFSTPLRPVLYYLVIAQQGAVVINLRARATWDPIVSETTPVLDQNLNTFYADGVGGALPGTFPAVAGSANGPSAALQFA
jgi:hypothetical protein